MFLVLGGFLKEGQIYIPLPHCLHLIAKSKQWRHPPPEVHLENFESEMILCSFFFPGRSWEIKGSLISLYCSMVQKHMCESLWAWSSPLPYPCYFPFRAQGAAEIVFWVAESCMVIAQRANKLANSLFSRQEGCVWPCCT